MPELRFEDNVYQVDDFDTVLNTLLKNGHAIPNFCRGGICHSCMMKAEEGMPLPFTQIGLKDELVAENYFLTCQCAVYCPMTIRRPDKDKRTRFVAMVRDKVSMADNVVKILLRPEHEFVYRAGQFTTLINVDGLVADFPIASIHGEGRLMEFHIADDEKNPLSRYIFSELEVGDGLEIQTALGDCYYNDELKSHDLVVIGVDSACASGISVAKQALLDKHTGSIQLIFGQHQVGSGYFDNALQPMIDEFGDLAKENVASETIAHQEMEALVESLCNRLKEMKLTSSTVVLLAVAPAWLESIASHLQGMEIRSLSIDAG